MKEVCRYVDECLGFTSDGHLKQYILPNTTGPNGLAPPSLLQILMFVRQGCTTAMENILVLTSVRGVSSSVRGVSICFCNNQSLTWF